jgi:DNA-3-methyladenine glycosylase
VNPPLSRKFYLRPAPQVARGLLGKILTLGDASGRIVETEAYLGEDDAAAHSASGLTKRTRVIFGPPGHAYVYFVYGMHNCLNIVCEPEGVAGCVLIRALEGLNGAANGPGKLTRALGINLAHNGVDVTEGPITIHESDRPEKIVIATSPRIGISKSAELPLRFFIKGNPSVSKSK